MSKPIFIMYNNHVKDCGNPPEISNKTSANYYGYFENEHGEQWIFVYDRNTKKAELRGGDVEWQNVFQVNNGHVKEIILTPDESQWLQACWADHDYEETGGKHGLAFEKDNLKSI